MGGPFYGWTFLWVDLFMGGPFLWVDICPYIYVLFFPLSFFFKLNIKPHYPRM